MSTSRLSYPPSLPLLSLLNTGTSHAPSSLSLSSLAIWCSAICTSSCWYCCASCCISNSCCSSCCCWSCRRRARSSAARCKRDAYSAVRASLPMLSGDDEDRNEEAMGLVLEAAAAATAATMEAATSASLTAAAAAAAAAADDDDGKAEADDDDGPAFAAAASVLPSPALGSFASFVPALAAAARRAAAAPPLPLRMRSVFCRSCISMRILSCSSSSLSCSARRRSSRSNCMVLRSMAAK